MKGRIIPDCLLNSWNNTSDFFVLNPFELFFLMIS